MGIKKLFHRNRDDSPQQSPNNSPGSPGTSGDPALRTSLYQSASPGGLPQTGDYPMKGNSNTQTSPSPGNRIRKYPNANTNQQNFPSNAPQPDLSAASSARPTAINRNDIAPTEPNNVVPPDMGSTVRAVDEGRDRNIEEPLSKGFSALSVGDEDTPRSWAKPHGPRYPTKAPGQPTYDQNVHVQNTAGISRADMKDPQFSYMSAMYGDDTKNRNPGDRQVGTMGSARSAQESLQRDPGFYQTGHDGRTVRHNDGILERRNNASSHTPAAEYDPLNRQAQGDKDLARKPSIPRKQVGSSIGSSPSMQSSLPSHSIPSHSPHSSLQKPLPSNPPRDSSVKYGAYEGEEDYSSPTNLNGQSRASSDLVSTNPTPEDVLDRAKSNTVKTEVVESIAPAVVHETVHQEIHHVREEVITREIHNHEVYHRILPVIDVEVLPPRHFLPVEGGGLVEISADEVPSRGKSWVIAETASKIPSDELASKMATRFSAREFHGIEGDAKQYMTPEGYERTEQTWVHAPQLETGGRDTGQTWPMEFDHAPPHQKNPSSPSKVPKRKSSKKHGMVQPTSAQRTPGVGNNY